MDVLVHTMSGDGYPMRVGSEWTVRELKMYISDQLHIPSKLQRLIIGDKILQDGQYMETWCDSQGPLEITVIRRSHDVAEWLQKVAKDGMCLQNAGFGVQSDPEVVLVAISQNGLALQFAAAELRADRDFITRAVAQNAGALAFAEGDLQSDKDFVLHMVRLNGCALAGASDALRADWEVVLTAAKENHYALTHASKVLKKDVGFIQVLLQQRVHGAFEFASWNLQKDDRLRHLATY